MKSIAFSYFFRLFFCQLCATTVFRNSFNKSICLPIRGKLNEDFIFFIFLKVSHVPGIWHIQFIFHHVYKCFFSAGFKLNERFYCCISLEHYSTLMVCWSIMVILGNILRLLEGLFTIHGDIKMYYWKRFGEKVESKNITEYRYNCCAYPEYRCTKRNFHIIAFIIVQINDCLIKNFMNFLLIIVALLFFKAIILLFA